LIISNLIGQRFVTEKRQEDGENYYVHRVLQARLLRGMNANPQERDEIFRVAFDLVRYHLPRPSLDTPEPSKWNAFKEYLPHVLSLQRAYADPLSITSPAPFLELAELFKDGGVLLWQRYISNDALKLLNTAEKILDELESEEENLRVEINITINLLLQYFGISHRKESKDRLASILEYRKKIVSRKAPEEVTREDEILLNDANADYANALLQFNDYKTAEPIYKDCYTKYLELGSETEPSAAFALAKLNHHMAYCKMYRREFDKAIELAEKAVAIVSKLGDKQMMLRYQFDLACIILQSGAREKALALHQEILDARLGLQGRASYFSLQSQYAVAALCHYMGKLDQAE
jgi:tetratricopeptide (TPR) repeat protein